MFVEEVKDFFITKVCAFVTQAQTFMASRADFTISALPGNDQSKAKLTI